MHAPLARRLSAAVAFSLLAVGCGTTAPPAAPATPSPPPPPVAGPAEPPERPEGPAVEKPEGGRPVPPSVFESRSRYPRTEVTEWRLANGARLVFRPLQTTPRHVALYAFAPGGFAAVPADLAAGVPAVMRTASATGSEPEVHAALTAREAVLYGTAATGALGLLFERVGALLTARDVEDSPHRLSVEEALSAALAGLPPTGTRPDPRTAQAVYERLFGDPRRFTFVLVGDASPEAVEAEAARLVRLRPSREALLAPPDSAGPVRIPMQAERWTLPPDGEAPVVAVAFQGRVEPGYDALAALDVLAALVEDAVGGEARATAAVHFDAGVGEIRVVVEGRGAAGSESAVFDAVRALRREPPSARALARARERRRASHEASLETADGWLAWLGRLYRYDHDTREALSYGRRLSGVAAERVGRLARAVLDPEHAVLVRRPPG